MDERDAPWDKKLRDELPVDDFLEFPVGDAHPPEHIELLAVAVERCIKAEVDETSRGKQENACKQ